MSIDLFYPGNRDRAKRVSELTNDIAGMQRNISETNRRLDEADRRMVPLMNKILSNNGLSTYTELINRVLNSLPSEEQERVRSMLQQISDVSSDIEQAFGIVIVLTAVSGGALLTTKTIQFVSSAGMYASVRLVALGIARALAGVGDAARFLRAAASVTRAVGALRGASTGTGLSRGIEFVSKGAKALLVLGLVIDGVLAIIAAVEGDKQRTKLREAINDYFGRRVEVAYFQTLANDAASFSGKTEAIFTLQAELEPDIAEIPVRKLMEKMAGNIEGMWDKSSYSSVAEVWANTDRSRGSWTNEDPSLADTIKKIETAESDM